MTTTFRHYSPSQVEMANRCLAKWAFDKLARIPRPSTKNQQKGTDVHAKVEDYYRTGILPTDPHALAGVTNPGLPKPGPLVTVEGKFTLPIREGVNYTGIIDLLDRTEPLWPTIIDHKTSSNLSYAKESAQLKTDIQMVGYAHYVFATHPEVEGAIVAHNVIDVSSRKRPDPRPLTKAWMDRPHVATQWQHQLKVIDDLEERRARPDVSIKDFDRNGEKNGECKAYGGCPFVGPCLAAKLGGTVVFTPPDAPRKEEEKMNTPNNDDAREALKRRLAEVQKKREEATAAPAPTPTPAPTPSPATVPQTAAERIAALKALKEKAAATPTPTPPPVEAKVEVPPPPPPVEVKVEVPPPVEEKKGPGRPAGAKNKPKDVPPAPATSSSIDTIYVDCLPMGLPVAAIETVAQPLLDQIVANTQLHWALIEYGKGKGLLITGLQNLPAYPAHIAIDSSTALGQVALEALIPKARLVVRGTR